MTLRCTDQSCSRCHAHSQSTAIYLALRGLFALALLIATGCASIEYQVQLPEGKTQNDYVVDSRVCGLNFQDTEYYSACMKKKGYKFQKTTTYMGETKTEG